MRTSQVQFVVAVLLALAFLLLPGTALAYESAQNDPYRNLNRSFYTSSNRFYPTFRGECTWYSNGRAQEAGWDPGFYGDAGLWWERVPNYSRKDQTPAVGSIMCLSGHVTYVVQVIDANTWVVDEYNQYPAYGHQWSRETVRRVAGSSNLVKLELAKTAVTLKGFIHPPVHPNGVFKPEDSSSVFLIQNGVRQAFNSWDSFLDYFYGSPPPITTVTSAQIYERTSWRPPVPHLVMQNSDGTIWWIRETADPYPIGRWVCRAFNTAAAYEGMDFLWTDWRHVNYFVSWKYPRLSDIPFAEPVGIITDGPFVNRNADGSYSGGFRLRNLSIAGNFASATIRVVRSDGAWYDFPWSPGFNLGKNQEYVWWSTRRLPPGSYRIKVVYSYYSFGRNFQFFAPGAGLYPYPDSLGQFVVN
ncbi:MAG: hypothetical protein BGO01_00945 [Armatimonadetes bacterium 55-13]|nr:CHAP domain-containing protein [Armatimonadota bacterium]OJU62371.1 MAG: hypothetical protein BGO01_00945 [Armatimonadetes bacterium 55-13]